MYAIKLRFKTFLYGQLGSEAVSRARLQKAESPTQTERLFIYAINGVDMTHVLVRTEECADTFTAVFSPGTAVNILARERPTWMKFCF
jgi:hypothetical protein